MKTFQKFLKKNTENLQETNIFGLIKAWNK